jgi:hypothetical protein
LDIKSSQSDSPAQQKQEAEEVPRTMVLDDSARLNKLNTPGVRNNGGCDAKRNHVGKRIHFPAEIANSVGHAGYPTVQAIERDRDPDGF